MAFVSLLVTACGRGAGAGDDVAASASVAEQPSPVSIVSRVENGVACYGVVEPGGAVVIPDVCPLEDVSGDVRFEAFETWNQHGVTVVFITPGLAVNSSQRFSRDEEFGWTAFITEPDGVARFTLQSSDNTVNCSVSVTAVDCA